MDKIEQLYKLYIEKGLITSETSLEDFANANKDIQGKLYELGKTEGLFVTTGLNDFQSAWAPAPAKTLDPADVDPTVVSLSDTGSGLVDGSLESVTEVVINSKSRDAIIQEIFGGKSYLQKEELSGFNQGVQSVIKNNEQFVQQVADRFNGINYSSQDDHDLDGLDSFAKKNPDKPVFVYDEGSDGLNYKDSLENIITLYKKYNSLKKRSTSEKGISYEEVKAKEKIEKQFNADYDIHMGRFKTTNSNVEFITTKDLSKKRLNYKGKEVRQEIVKDKELKTVVDSYNDFGSFYLSPKETEIHELNNKLKDPSLKNRKEVEAKIKELRSSDGEELYDPVTGRVYNLDRDDNVPAQLIKSYEKSEKLAAKQDVDYLKDLSFDKQTKLIGAAKDLYSILSDEEYVSKKGGFGSAKKFTLDTLKYIVDNNKLPESLKGLEGLLSKKGSSDSFYNLAPELGSIFNNTLNDYLEVNRAIKTNTNILTSTEKEYFNEFLDSTMNKFGLDINTKAERQEDVYSLLKESGFTDESVNKLSKGVINPKTGEAAKNVGQVIARGVPDLAMFVAEVAVFKGLTGNGIARLGKASSNLINKAYNGNKYVTTASKAIIPALVEGLEFSGTTAMTNALRGEDESIAQSGLAGFSMGIGGKLTRGFFSELTKGLGKTSIPGKLADFSIVRGIGDSKVVNAAYNSFTSASGGAGAYISGNILLDPVDFEYNRIGETYLEEGAKMFLLGKLQKGMKSPKASISRVYENYQADILAFNNLNPTAYKSSKILEISTDNIKKPTENSNEEIRIAWQKSTNKVIKKLIKKEITQEQANEELFQIDGARKSLEVQVGINQAKEVIKQSIKDGNSVSEGEQYIIGKKLKNGGVKNLTVKDFDKLSKMSPESIAINSGVEFNPNNVEQAKNTLDLASKINSILNGETSYISSKLGQSMSTGTSVNEFKSNSEKSKQKIFNFLVERIEANNIIEALDKVSTDNLNEDQIKQLNLQKQRAKNNTDLYYEGGVVYDNLQSELKGETWSLINADYIKYVKENGNEGKVVLHKTTEDYNKFVSKKDAGSTAFFDPATGERHINIQRSLEIKDPFTVIHEETHHVLKSVLKKDGKVTNEGIEIIDALINGLEAGDAKLLREEVASRYGVDDKGKVSPKKDWYEENLTVFTELVKAKKILKGNNSEKGLFDFAVVLKNKIFKNLEINGETPAGLLNMLEGFARGEKAVIKAAYEFANRKEKEVPNEGKGEQVFSKKDVENLEVRLEELIDNEYEMDEGDFESQKSNLEFKIKQAKAKEVKPIGEVSKKPSVKKEGPTREKISKEVRTDNLGPNDPRSKEIMDAYDKGMTSIERAKYTAKDPLPAALENKLLPLFKGYINTIVNQAFMQTKEEGFSKQDAIRVMEDNVLAAIRTFNPSVNKDLAGYVKKYGVQTRKSDMFKDVNKEYAEDLSAASDITSENTFYENNTESSGLKESTQKMIKATSFGPISDPAVLEAVENVIEVKETERPNFKSLNNKYFDKVSEVIFGISGKKTRGNASLKYDKSGGSSEANSLQNVFKNDNDVKKFIKTMPDYNIATKETVINEQGEIIDVSRDTYGRSIGINPKVLAIFYDKVEGAIPGVSSPNGRSLGQTTQTDVYKLKPEFTGNISPASVAKLQSLIGVNKGTLSIPIKGEARTEFGSILTGLTKMYIDNVINTVGRSKLETNQAKADLGAGKSSLMFSTGRYKENLEKNNIDSKKIFEGWNAEKSLSGSEDEFKVFSKRFESDVEKLLKYLPAGYRPSNFIGVYSTDIIYKKLKGGKEYTGSEKNVFSERIKKLQEIAKKAGEKAGGGKIGFGSPSSEIGDTLNKVENSFSKKGISNIKQKNKKYEKSFEEMWVSFYKASKKDPSLIPIISMFLNGSNYDVAHPQRRGANIFGYQIGVKPMENNKGQTRTFEYEHALPSNQAADLIFDKMIKSKNQKDFKKYLKDFGDNYKIIALGLKDNLKVTNAGYGKSMPKNWKNWWDRYLNPEVAKIDGGIDPFSILVTNKKGELITLSESAGWVDSSGKKLEQYQIDFYKNKSKIAKINNEKLPKSQRLDEGSTTEQVFSVMRRIDNEQNQAASEQFMSKDLDKEFNDIIENKTGIASYKEFARVKAEVRGKKKGRFNLFIPPSAEDFVGLLYYTLGKGKVGDAQMKWYKDNLLNPYARAIESITRDRNSLGRDFLALKKDLKIIPKNLKKKTKNSDFTREQAVRIYIWNKLGEDIPGLSKLDLVELVDIVNSDPQLKLFAQEVMKLNKGRAYTKPTNGWVAGTITTDLLESLNTTGRKDYLSQWQQNVDVIFSEKNLNKMEAAYGKSYRVAMENILHRMETGRNRNFGVDTLTGRFTDWINASTAGIMFFNTRSAVLQTISAINFINFSDNNVLAAGKAFANQPQYWSDFKKLFNSDFLTQRRDGLKIDINESDIADIARENGVRGVIGRLLKLGFLPTQIADSFAIASGGATFYRNRIKSLIKGGMDPVAAEKQAMMDFRETAEESQQSSRPDKISQQQAGSLGRIVLAFANTPAQYARLMKKAASDLKNGRGDAKTNLSKILYYGVAQNLLFNALQQALFAISFGDDADDEELENKTINIANGMVDSVARGTGLYGVAFSVVKNASIKLYKQTQEKNPKYEDIALELLKISPPISSKIQKIRSAGRSASWEMESMKTKGFSLDNPAYLAAGNVVSSVFNIPLDRVIEKVENLKNASDSEIETYKRIALLAGWADWELGIDSKPKEKKKDKSTKNKRINKYIVRDK
jgi:hypothetical protein